MTDRPESLLEIAGAVSDGEPVDWDAKHRSGAASKDWLDQLRIIEKILRVHGHAPDETPSCGPEGSHLTTGSLKAQETSAPSAAPSRWGHLEIVERIGKGGYGDVYRAYDPNLGTEVALKLVGPGRKPGHVDDQRYLDEARRLARVRHPNVLVVHGADRHDGRVGLWTDLLQGRTLEECIEQQGPFGAEEAGLIGIELCRALAAVHGAGLVHQDVKTSNVMREKGGRIVLMDFSATTESRPHAAVADGAPTVGTPLFMAPELLHGGAPTVASDIYSLGVLLYRLVSGRFPVLAATLPELIEQQDRARFIPLHDVRPGLPTPFIQVVERALAHDPGDRFASVGEMEHSIRMSLGICDETGGDAPKPVRRYRRWGIALGALAAVTVATGIGLGLFPGLGPGPLRVEASLYRFDGGNAERLSPKATVHPGDLLFLEIAGSTPMYVYVINEDAAGHAFGLFPLTGLNLTNPLSRGTRHRLPGLAGQTSRYWEVTSAGGRESFLVIASRTALDEVARELARLRVAGSSEPVVTGREAPGSLRGVGGLVERVPSRDDAETGLLPGTVDRLAELVANRRGVWTWEIELTSAAP